MNLKNNLRQENGFTLTELLVVIAIIALISSVIAAAVTKAKVRARDSQRIQNARQLSLALEQYEQSKQTYKIAGSGYGGEGYGYVAKGADEAGYSNSIVSALKADGYYSSINLKDPIYGLDNYYLGLCTSTGAYNIFVKLEQEDLTQSSTTISTGCGGTEAAALGFNYIADVIGANQGGIASSTGSQGGGGYVAAIGTVDLTYATGTHANNIVWASAIQSDGKVIIGGQFTMVEALSRNRIARLNVDGSIDVDFVVGAGALNTVYAIAIQPDGKILIGGAFTNYGGTPRNRIARINTDGSSDANFYSATGTDNVVRMISVQPDGKILIGGQFTTYNGVSRNRIARLNSDGTLDTTFDPSTGANNVVYTSQTLSDGKIVIGGSFTTYNGATSSMIARLNSDGSYDPTYNIGTGADNVVYTTQKQLGDKIVFGGQVSTYNGTSTNAIFRLDQNGNIDPSFNTGGTVNNYVYTIATVPDGSGKMYIGGYFSIYGGIARNYFTRITANGANDLPFNIGTAAAANVKTINVFPNGNVFVGGQFGSFNGVSSAFYFKLK